MTADPDFHTPFTPRFTASQREALKTRMMQQIYLEQRDTDVGAQLLLQQPDTSALAMQRHNQQVGWVCGSAISGVN